MRPSKWMLLVTLALAPACGGPPAPGSPVRSPADAENEQPAEEKQVYAAGGAQGRILRAVLQFRAQVEKRARADGDIEPGMLQEILGESPRALLEAELTTLQAITGPLPDALRAWLQQPVHAMAPEVFVDGLGYVALSGPPGILEANRNLHEARGKYAQFAEVPPCLVISHTGGTFVTVELSSGKVLLVDSDTGGLARREETLEAFLELLAPLVEAGVREDADGA